MRRSILIITLLAVLGIAFALSADAEESTPTTIHMWVDGDGVVFATDDEKAIPEKYRSEVETTTVDGLGDYARLTPTDPEASRTYAEQLSARLAHLRAMNQPTSNPNRLNDCTGHVLVTQKRMQIGDRSKTMFVMTDECGRTVSVTPFYPEVQANR